ncbi:MAG: excinuclease ABC subunit UvrA [Anaerolineales bacterium]|nr:MAG: excinuclease ABC subunit UvrA [Anaerolineales bacterium]
MSIKVYGANENNLKNITVTIPRNRLVVITGVSGSGKSSLAFNTIFAEAQREFLESLSTYARKSLPHFSQPNVRHIEGLSPGISIDQQPLARNPRSTVGTVTEVYTFLRLMYSRLGGSGLSAGEFSFNTPSGACQTCSGLGVEMQPDLEKLLDKGKSLSEGAIIHKGWAVDSRNWNILKTIGLLEMNKPLARFTKAELDLLLYSEPIQSQKEEAGYVQGWAFEGIIRRLMKRQGDSRGQTGTSYDQQFFFMDTCSECQGARLNAKARSVLVNDRSIVELSTMQIDDLLMYISTLEGAVVNVLKPFMEKMLEHLVDIGLGYLSLSRSVSTLSNGEAQRVKLARQLGSSLTELIYVMDEPTAGLHSRDISHLCSVLKQLSKKPNTVIVVEHDKDMMLNADFIIDMGPGAGSQGGEIIAIGSPEQIMRSGTATGNYLSNKERIPRRKTRRTANKFLSIVNANIHNLKNVNTKMPLGVLTCIAGVSGSGKSSLIEFTLKKYPDIVVVDQNPPGVNSRSNPATYTKVLDDIRKIFAESSGQDAALFSFNSAGACEVCEGSGYSTIDMHFLGEVNQVCEECEGRRFKENVLSIKYQGKSIVDVLDMTAEEAFHFFENNENIRNKLNLLVDVGLGYLRLGQPLGTLSGGEAQRIKLVSRLGRKGDVYILDEPTRGLHFADIDRLIRLLDKLVDGGNTVIVVEHNLDVIKNSDWVIDMGPESGKRGGEVIAEGTPEDILLYNQSVTGRFLKQVL